MSEGQCTITHLEMAEVKYSDTQRTLHLLKEKGAPVMGTINLQFDPDYIYERYEDPRTMDVIFRWRNK